jgi:hypothetical protein
MKPSQLISAIVILFLLACWGLFAQEGNASEEAEKKEKAAWFFAGPRLGMTGVTQKRDSFDAVIQKIYPSDRKYFPLYSQLGLGFDQRIRLGDKGGSLNFQELFFVGGLDQNIALPSFSLYLTLKFASGFELGLGPEIGIKAPSGSIEVDLSLIYLMGWTFDLENLSIPIYYTIIPTPTGGYPRMSLFTGISFPIRLGGMFDRFKLQI